MRRNHKQDAAPEQAFMGKLWVNVDSSRMTVTFQGNAGNVAHILQKLGVDIDPWVGYTTVQQRAATPGDPLMEAEAPAYVTASTQASQCGIIVDTGGRVKFKPYVVTRYAADSVYDQDKGRYIYPETMPPDEVIEHHIRPDSTFCTRFNASVQVRVGLSSESD